MKNRLLLKISLLCSIATRVVSLTERQRSIIKARTHVNRVVGLGIELDRRLQLHSHRFFVSARQSHTALRHDIVKVSVRQAIAATDHQQTQNCRRNLHFLLSKFYFSFHAIFLLFDFFNSKSFQTNRKNSFLKEINFFNDDFHTRMA